MVKKRIIEPNRVRRIKGGFSFIPHRFLTDGFLSILCHNELILYFFLVLAGDRYGLSYYSDKTICSLLRFSIEDYNDARTKLVEKDLIVSDGLLFQVLELPVKPALSTSMTAEKLSELLRKVVKVMK